MRVRFTLAEMFRKRTSFECLADHAATNKASSQATQVLRNSKTAPCGNALGMMSANSSTVGLQKHSPETRCKYWTAGCWRAGRPCCSCTSCRNNVLVTSEPPVLANVTSKVDRRASKSRSPAMMRGADDPDDLRIQNPSWSPNQAKALVVN